MATCDIRADIKKHLSRKWLTRRYDKKQSHLYLHCAGIRVSEQLTQLLWKNIPHVVITSAYITFIKQFSRIQELTGPSGTL